MPSLNDIAELAEALGTRALVADEKRCVAVRNRHSRCRRCMEACIADAIRVERNKVTVDPATCVSCGACTTACPNEALISLDPTDEELASAIAAAVKAIGGQTAVFACARMAARRDGDPDKYAAVPCLARMEESLLLQLASCGVVDVVLVDGGCESCKYGKTSAGVDVVVSQANTLIAAQGGAVRVRRVSEFPPEAVERSGRKSFARARRGLFSQAGEMAKDVARAATGKVVDEALGTSDKKEFNIRDLVDPDRAGELLRVQSARHMRVLDAMDAMGQSVADAVDTRLFGKVTIDMSRCRACGMCAVFCPTKALTKSSEKPANGVGSYLEFNAMECVQCYLCADACLGKCLTVASSVPTSQLFDFEPELIHLPEPPARRGLM